MHFNQLFDIISTFILLDHYKDSINMIERLIISLSLSVVEYKHSPIIGFGKYYLLFPGAIERMFLLFIFKDVIMGCVYNLISNLNREMIQIVFIVLLCAFTQILIYLMTRRQDIGSELLVYKRTSIRDNFKQMKKFKCFKNTKKRSKTSLNFINIRSLYHLKYCYTCFYFINLFTSGCKVLDIMTDVKHKIVLFLKKSLKNRKIITNLSRKVFHLFVFLMFAHPTPLKIQLAEVLFVFLIVTSDSTHFRLIFRNFLSNNDKGRVITSHVYLLSAVLFPYYLLDSDEYKLNVISICIFDSLCSLIGTAMRKKTKSIEGTAFGLIFTLLFTKIFYRYIDVIYFIFIAIVEQITFINDNISIPFFTVVYFSLKKRFNF